MKYIRIILISALIAIFRLPGADMALNLKNLNFDQGTELWDVPKDFQIIRGKGRNGTNALYIRRDKAAPPGKPNQPVSRKVRFEHGKNYKMKMTCVS